MGVCCGLLFLINDWACYDLLCRFYFVSDPTLLEILSLGSDPPSVVPHFQSGLFDSLTNVTFDKVDKTRMLEMFSQQGEKVRRPCLHVRHVFHQGRRANIDPGLKAIAEAEDSSLWENNCTDLCILVHLLSCTG
jgi:hypothetical protein